jgi:hypothetical protein
MGFAVQTIGSRCGGIGQLYQKYCFSAKQSPFIDKKGLVACCLVVFHNQQQKNH